MNSFSTRVLATLLALVAAAAALTACNRADDKTAGQKVDDAVVKSERKADEVAVDARQAGRDAKQAVAQATETVANKSKDALITSEIKARLVGDPQLKALSINVDTTDGRVVLHGTAPDTASRTRATELARGVDGVLNVNNELSVQSRN